MHTRLRIPQVSSIPDKLTVQMQYDALQLPQIHMSFNVITGQMAHVTWKTGWVENPQEDDVWGYKEKTYVTVKFPITNPPQTVLVPVCWGREYEVLTSGGSEKEEEPHAVRMYTEALEKGHEIGNHTIDHMESNSGLPQEFFPNSGEGFDNDPNENEAYEVWEHIGWLVDAGKKISREAWKGIVELAEAELSDYLGVSISAGNLYAFRAPRLELNTNMFLALADLGYTYDCGLEEGYEENRDGTNMLWPYTTDNGSPNVWTQKEFGENPPIDEMPTGFWEIPVNVMVVPEDIREEVWNHAKEINDHAPDAGEFESLESWSKHGKITGFDFNLFILWGMTGEHWLKTMQHNLDMRIANNKAPLHYGCHTDYYTPMYDYGTLLSEYNKSSYGLVITKNWNTYDTRIAVTEEFVDYALSKKCVFVSGIELIEKLREIQKNEVFGNEVAYTTTEWHFFKNDLLNSSTPQEIINGSLDNVSVHVDKANNNEYPFPGFGAYEHAGFFAGIDHIAVTYKTTAPLLLKFVLADDKPWEVLLNNIGPEINSGKIPLSAFHYNQHNVGTQSSINTAKIIGVEVQILTVGDKVEDVTFSLKDIKLYGAATGVTVMTPGTGQNDIMFCGISRNVLKVKVNEPGRYSVRIVSVNGRVVK